MADVQITTKKRQSLHTDSELQDMHDRKRQDGQDRRSLYNILDYKRPPILLILPLAIMHIL